MGIGKHLLNGGISLTISVVLTAALSDDEKDGYEMPEMLVAVGVSAFLSGFFTSYFTSE